MPPATLNLGGRKFVVIPASEYRQLKAKAKTSRNGRTSRAKRKTTFQERQDRGDVAEAIRRLAEPARVSHEQLKAELGL